MTSPGYDDGTIRVFPGDPGPMPPTGASTGRDQAGQVAGTAKEQAGQVAGTAKEQAGQVAGTAKEHAGHVAGTASEQASQVTGTAKEQASEVVGTAKEQVTQVAGEAANHARDLLDQARTQVQGQVVSQKGQLTERLRQIATELSDLASGKGSPQGAGGAVAGLAQQASQRAQGFADYIERREPQDLLNDGRAFAGRRPGAFLAGAAVLGAVAGRLVKGVKADSSSSGSLQGQASVPATLRSSQPAYGGALPPVSPVQAMPARPVSERPIAPVATPASQGARTDPYRLSGTEVPAEPVTIIDEAPLGDPMPLTPQPHERPYGGPTGG